MTLRRIFAFIFAANLLLLAGCAALPAIFGAAAPVAVAAIDAYAAQAQRLAPVATPQDQAALAALLAERDRCVVNASTALDREPDGAAIVKALAESADAAAKLAAAIEAARGKDGGT